MDSLEKEKERIVKRVDNGERVLATCSLGILGVVTHHTTDYKNRILLKGVTYDGQRAWQSVSPSLVEEPKLT